MHAYGLNGTIERINVLFKNRYLTDSVFSEFADGASADQQYNDTVRALMVFYSQVKKRYREIKDEHSFLDYNDLELLAKDVLERDGSVRAGYLKKIKFLMIDEFQDTNPIQKEIIYLLSGRADDD
ncbi:UvrD-helicase domain-containing protein, partial [Thermodesulfobacteriota bacterium]